MKLQVMQYNLPNKVLSKTLSLEMVLNVLLSVRRGHRPIQLTQDSHIFSEMDYNKIQPVTRPSRCLVNSGD